MGDVTRVVDGKRGCGVDMSCKAGREGGKGAGILFGGFW